MTDELSGDPDPNPSSDRLKRWVLSFGVMIIWPILYWVIVDPALYSQSHPVLMKVLFPFCGLIFHLFQESYEGLVAGTFLDSFMALFYARWASVLIFTAIWIAVLFFPYPFRSRQWRRGIVAIQCVYSFSQVAGAFFLLSG